MATWEELRKEARKLEGDLDVKLSSYAKLCSMLGQTGSAVDSWGSPRPLQSSHRSLVSLAATPDRAAYKDSSSASAAGDVLGSKEASWHSMEMEIESLLGRLEDVNDKMSNHCSSSGSNAGGSGAGSSSSNAGGSPTKDEPTASMSQKLGAGRHRDILLRFHQEFRQTKGNMTTLREHAELMSSSTSHLEDGRIWVSCSLLATAQSRTTSASQSGTGLLTERKAIQGNIAQIDIVISQATATKEALASQRSLFSGWQGRLKVLSERFPAVRGVLTAIRRRRSRDSIILGGVIVLCTAFLIIYWLLK